MALTWDWSAFSLFLSAGIIHISCKPTWVMGMIHSPSRFCCISSVSSDQPPSWVQWPTSFWGLCTLSALCSWWILGGGGNMCHFRVRPCVIMNQFRFDVDVGLVRVYLHHSEEIAASIGHLPPVVYDVPLNLGPQFCHIVHTTIVIRHWKSENYTLGSAPSSLNMLIWKFFHWDLSKHNDEVIKLQNNVWLLHTHKHRCSYVNSDAV